jgi:hypothetical protein
MMRTVGTGVVLAVVGLVNWPRTALTDPSRAAPGSVRRLPASSSQVRSVLFSVQRPEPGVPKPAKQRRPLELERRERGARRRR